MKTQLWAAVTLGSLLAATSVAPAYARAGDFRWPATTGSVSVIRGKIDRWSGAGVLEAGGFLGLGNTHLKVIPQTLIVDANGNRVRPSALKAGMQIASIYKTDRVVKGEPAGTTAAGGEFKVALVIVLAPKQTS